MEVSLSRVGILTQKILKQMRMLSFSRLIDSKFTELSILKMLSIVKPIGALALDLTH